MTRRVAAASAVLLVGCAHAPTMRAPMSASDATRQAQSECEAFAKDTATVNVDQCVADRAPRIIDADRARARLDAAASEGTRSKPPPPPVVGPCRWRAEYSTMTDCQ